MPSRGSYVEAGLNKAASLMRQTGLNQGEILLVSDADVSPQAVDVAQSLRREGYRIDVLAVGTEDGAPIPEAEGGFLTDKSGQVVVPRLDTAGLKRLASVGGGRYAQLTPNDRDLDALFSAEAIGALAGESDEDPYQADIWRDQGIWLTLALLPLVALAFRRGWIYLLIAGIVLPLPRAEAFEWSDLWQRPDQQGLSAFQSDAPAEAAKLFDDPQWRAAARYRAGDFKGSASSLAGIDTAEAQYNRGNGLARSGALEEAVAAYDRALALDPGHEDAAYNREIVADLLEQQKQEQEQQQQEQQQEQGEQSEDQGEQASDQSEQSESEGGQDEQNQQSSQASNDDRQGRDDQQQSDDAQSQDQSDDEQQADAEQQPEQSEPDEQQSLQASAVPEDVEEWASEQAADQWLRRIPQDPGGLLRRKFLYQYQRLGVDQDGNYVWPGDEQQPW
jgi:Ca-activated chloride channel family protein